MKMMPWFLVKNIMSKATTDEFIGGIIFAVLVVVVIALFEIGKDFFKKVSKKG